MLTDYHIRPFSLGCYSLMRELFLSAYEIDIDYVAFSKQFDTKILGHEVIGFLAIHKSTNEPAAYYGVFPVKISIDNKEVLAAQSGATMTHKNHRKKGLFIELAKITFEKCATEGIQLIFGLPNQNSYHGFIKKLDWIHLDDVYRYDLKTSVKAFPLAKIFKKISLFNFYVRYAKFLLKNKKIPAPASFDNPLKTSNKILRNKEYLIYKNGPNKIFIRVNEIVFWIKLTDVFWIGEISDYGRFNFDTIRKLKKIAFLLGYNTITFHINKQMQSLPFLTFFKPYESEPLCFYYPDKDHRNSNLIITAADFDTW